MAPKYLWNYRIWTKANCLIESVMSSPYHYSLISEMYVTLVFVYGLHSSRRKNNNRVFNKDTELAIIAIFKSEALQHENKKSSNKMLLQWVLYMGHQPFRSNVLLSELLMHMLLGISLNCLLFNLNWTYII